MFLIMFPSPITNVLMKELEISTLYLVFFVLSWAIALWQLVRITHLLFDDKEKIAGNVLFCMGGAGNLFDQGAAFYGGPEGSNTNKKENTNKKRENKNKKKENTHKKKENTNYKKKTHI